MIHLLDANTLIDANRDYYPFEAVPEFWAWLEHLGNADVVKIPLEIYEELKVGNDVLAEWVNNADIETSMLLQAEAHPTLIQEVINIGYAPDLNDIEIEKVGRDPFLISYALSDPANHAIVTTEKSKPSTQRANRKVPDVCNALGITNMNTFQFIRDQNFRTNWNA